MMTERTLAIIKPDAVERKLIGNILSRIEESGLDIIALRTASLSKEEAEGFYNVHAHRPFFDSLTSYMSSGPVVLAVLEGDNVISKWRQLMGATDPKEAEEGTIRRDLAVDKEKNSVHGSDSPESVAFEIPYFFNGL